MLEDNYPSDRTTAGASEKVELPHEVVVGVVGPHGCKDFTNLAEVLLDISPLDRLPLQG